MVIALLTDFGTADYFAASMKGRILSVNPNATIVDITHEIPPQDIESAAFTLAACYRDFPSGTIFIAVVDPGVGSSRRSVLMEAEQRFFFAPDNGLLSLIASRGEMDACRFFEISNTEYFGPNISRTFHGRDIFAPAAGHLSLGVEPEKFGGKIYDAVRLEQRKPERISDRQILGEVIHIDRFGNLVTNLTEEMLPEKYSIEIAGTTIGENREFYSEGRKGFLFTIIGSAGYLEISAFEDSAARLLAIGVGEKARLTNCRATL